MAEWWEAAEVVAPDDEWWAGAEVIGQAPPGPTAIDYAGQVGAGSQTGIAQMLGMPVDAVAGAMSGLGGLTGLWGPIENPVGGSASIEAALSPFRAGIAEPTTDGLRAARRIGEEIGAGSVTAPIAAAAVPARAGAAAGAELLSALGSGAGAAAANYIAPDSVAAEVAGLLLGGVPASMAASRALGLGGTDDVIRGGIDEQRAIASDAYGAVRDDPRFLPQGDVFGLGLGIEHRMASEGIDPALHPGSSAVANALADRSMMPSRIEDIEKMRRLTTSAMPATASPDDQRLATIMRNEITDYLDNLNDPTADLLRDGRNAHRRASAAQSVSEASTKAARRAASTGSGGNEINAMRQNLRSILDNPRKARSFTPVERALMEDVVMGDAAQNTMRSLSRFAPTSGGLSAMLGVGGVMASPTVALPIMAATEGAKALGERSTRKAIDALMQSIAPDRVMSVGDSGLNPVLRALLGARAVSAE